MSSTVASFSIVGRNMTAMARNMVLDGDWRKSTKFLIDEFEGMTHGYAHMILRGTHVLDGINNDIEIIEERDDNYIETMNEIYCHNSFYELGQLYEFQSLVTNETVHEDIRRRQLNHDIPAYEEYVRKYLCPQKALVFNVTMDSKNFYTIIATKKDNNDLPLWFGEDDFSRSAKAFFTKHLKPAPVPAVDKGIFIQSVDEPTEKPDWYKSIRTARALQTASNHGFDSIEGFSNSLRKNVLQTIVDRGVQWKTLHINHDGINETIQYPYELAMAYVFSRTAIRQFAPKWTPVCPSNIKQDNDSRLHSDIWIALGFDFDGQEYDYSTKENLILSAIVDELHNEVFPAGEFITLNSAGLKTFTGKVVTPQSKKITKHDILVIPHAGSEFEIFARQAGLVISEVGGKLAHLVIVGREMGLPLVRVDNACELFKEDVVISLNFDECTLKVKR